MFVCGHFRFWPIRYVPTLLRGSPELCPLASEKEANPSRNELTHSKVTEVYVMTKLYRQYSIYKFPYSLQLIFHNSY